MRVIGFDPGLYGAIGVVSETGRFISVHDMPTMAASKNSDKQKVNVPELARILRSIIVEGDCIAVTEYVQPMPSIPGADGQRRGMGAASAFSFGKSVGHIEASILTLGVSLEWVTPAQWKKALNLNNSKDAARAFAQSVYPEAPLGLKKHHGRAEALLIARWYALKLRQAEAAGASFHREAAAAS
jgi:crossover junction endodeoxyribonuclease RuvC